MSAAQQLDLPPVTFQEYLDYEDLAEVRHEIWNGALVAMAGTSEEHVDVASNLSGELFQELKDSSCRIGGSDQLVYQPSRDKGVYPDITITCEPREYVQDGKNRDRALLNPTLIVEVLSKSTALRDLGPKREGYLAIPSLKEYVLVDPTTPWVRTLLRAGGGWLETTVTDPAASVRFESVNVTVPMADIYRGIAVAEVSTVVDWQADDDAARPSGRHVTRQ